LNLFIGSSWPTKSFLDLIDERTVSVFYLLSISIFDPNDNRAESAIGKIGDSIKTCSLSKKDLIV
jgi:hypothetical protein